MARCGEGSRVSVARLPLSVHEVDLEGIVKAVKTCCVRLCVRLCASLCIESSEKALYFGFFVIFLSEMEQTAK